MSDPLRIVNTFSKRSLKFLFPLPLASIISPSWSLSLQSLTLSSEKLLSVSSEIFLKPQSLHSLPAHSVVVPRCYNGEIHPSLAPSQLFYII